MASFGKASQALRAIQPWLGFCSNPTDSDEGDDTSIWRRPSTAETLVGSETSRSTNASELKQRRPATESDFKGWSKSLRSLAAHFYAEENNERSRSLYDSLPKTAGRKIRQSPRKPLTWSRSSTRSRRSTPGKFNARVSVLPDGFSQSPKSITPSPAPVLNVYIPKFNLAVDPKEKTVPAGDSTREAYRNDSARRTHAFEPDTGTGAASPLPTQEAGKALPPKIGWKFSVAGNSNDAYHELLQGSPKSRNGTCNPRSSSSNGKMKSGLRIECDY